MPKFQRIKGTHDILPQDARKWRYVEGVVQEVMQRYNFDEIRTPIFEETALFARGIGQLTDIVSKEMYTFLDRGKKSLTLKPEGTAPVIRAFIEHSLGEKKPVHKLYYISPMFRQENPQAGRLRQFHQFGAELVGSAAPEADVETIALAVDIYEQLGLKKYTLKINSVGDATCRAPYKERLKDYLRPRLDKLCRSCQERFDKNPLRILDCKEEGCRAETAEAPLIIDHLCEDCHAHFEAVKSLLSRLGIAFEVDHRLVRGLDYYTRTAFEILSGALGAQNALGGGGRYDLLAEELGGKPTPSVGFAAGIERLLMVLEKENLLSDFDSGPDVFIATLGEEARRWAVQTARQLRQRGLRVDYDFLGRSLKAQMKEANRSGARFALIVGENELQARKVVLRNLSSSEQETVAIDSLVGELEARLGKPG
ncbi:MAG: histidine--tRNA ligase [candidate division KSB1 bacterium]|nr:histidine--tRNA ligase [candidate division KSB1 bacterium]